VSDREPFPEWGREMKIVVPKSVGVGEKFVM
jgi:hypothetical protein